MTDLEIYRKGAEAFGRYAELEAENARLRAALTWVGQVMPGKTESGGAVVHMTWAEFNAMRVAVGLPPKPVPRGCS